MYVLALAESQDGFTLRIPFHLWGGSQTLILLDWQSGEYHQGLMACPLEPKLVDPSHEVQPNENYFW